MYIERERENCMYVCMHARTYVCTYVCVYESMYVCMYECIYPWTWVHVVLKFRVVSMDDAARAHLEEALRPSR